MLDPIGSGPLLKFPKGMTWGWAVWVTIGAAAGVSVMFPDLIDDWVGGMVADRLIGIAILGLVIACEVVQARRTALARPAR